MRTGRSVTRRLPAPRVIERRLTGLRLSSRLLSATLLALLIRALSSGITVALAAGVAITILLLLASLWLASSGRGLLTRARPARPSRHTHLR